MNAVNLSTIDVKLLKKQKAGLMAVARDKLRPDDMKNIGVIDGIINLLDYIQDAIELEPVTFNLLYSRSKKGDLKFKCPNCISTQLEELCQTDGVSSLITRLDAKGDFEFGPLTGNSDTQVYGYQCAGCGTGVEDSKGQYINDPVSLVNWLKKQPYNKKQRTVKQ